MGRMQFLEQLGAAEAERDELREERNTANNYILDGCGGQEYLDARLGALQAQNRALREALERLASIRPHNWEEDGDPKLTEAYQFADSVLAETRA